MSELIGSALEEAGDTSVVILEEGALAQVPAVFKELFGEARAAVVGDDRTMEVAGWRVFDELQAAGVEVSDAYVFPGLPELYARYENCEIARDVLRGKRAIPVAVGSGTLNDIVKRAAGELGIGYLCVATAASMDGYTAFGSSIALEGFKQTLSCPAPKGCIADTEILASAPQVMTASGYGDLIGKVPAGADWIIADALGIEMIDGSVWEKVQGPLKKALGRPEALAAGDIKATGELAEGLLMSGLAMQAHQSSRPASGAEHQFSHLWEMEGHGVEVMPRRLSHGFKVGIGSVAIAALYELLFDGRLEKLDIDAAVAAWRGKAELEAHVRALHPNPKLVDETVAQSLAKWIDAAQLRARLEQLVAIWVGLVPRLRAQLMPAAEIQAKLRAVGAPAHPSDIGLDWQRFKDTYVRAQMIRKRYTILDVAFEAGILEAAVEELFAPRGFWGEQRHHEHNPLQPDSDGGAGNPLQPEPDHEEHQSLIPHRHGEHHHGNR